MKIEYASKRIKEICIDVRVAERKYGVLMAKKLSLRIDQLSASESVEEMMIWHIGRCHALKGDRKNQYAMDLVHPYRLIFEQNGKELKIVTVIEIVDYH